MKQKFINLLLATCIVCCNAVAQPVIKGQRSLGGSDYDQVVTTIRTKDGGYLSGGNSTSNKSYEKSENKRGDQDYWIVKMDAEGKVQWDKTIGGIEYEDFKSVIQTYDGGYALIGESNSEISDEKSENSFAGSVDYWLVKLDSAGNIQWDKTIGGNGSEFLDMIVQTKDSGYVLAGSSDSPISGYKTEDSRGYFDYWVVKVNKRGNKVWDKTIGGNDYEFCSPFLLTNDGGILLGGFSASNISGEKTDNSRGDYDIWLVKLNDIGKILWDKTLGGNAFDGAFGIIQETDGSFIISGTSASYISGEKSEDSRGGSDYWLLKTDAKGNKIWDKTFGGNSDDHQGFGGQLIKTADGGYVLGGTSNSYISGEKTEDSRGGNDYWLVKTDASGNKQWDKTIGGYSDDNMGSVLELAPNKYLAAGSSWSFIGSDKKTFARGSLDYWLVNIKYTPTALTENNTSQLSQKLNDKIFTVYPNPAKDIINVHLNGTAVVSVVGQSGKIVLTKNITSQDAINVSALPAGIYYIKNNSTGETQKFLISR